MHEVRLYYGDYMSGRHPKAGKLCAQGESHYDLMAPKLRSRAAMASRVRFPLKELRKCCIRPASHPYVYLLVTIAL
jgi:hypothetical protein